MVPNSPGILPVLDIEKLSVSYGRTDLPAVKSVSLSLRQGEALGVVGESGSGKSSLALAVLRYLPKNARISATALKFEGREIYGLSDKEIQALRGDRIAAVYQNPGSALNPSMRIGTQITEVIMHHRQISYESAKSLALALLDRVRMRDPANLLRLYPHELSGGMQQRVNIAMAISLNPSLLVMDEPTTALDASVQSEIIIILNELRKDLGTSILLISHDLALVERCCDGIAVMRDGVIVETGKAQNILRTPRHSYTSTLVASLPASTSNSIERSTEADTRSTAARHQDGLWEQTAVKCNDISQSFNGRPILQEINLEISCGETFGLIGESGSGKSTLAKIVTGLQAPKSGSLQLFGNQTAAIVETRTLNERRTVQMVFQSPDRTLNPQHRIRRILGRPLQRHAQVRRRDLDPRIRQLMAAVQLANESPSKKPFALSGGQRQRVAIARAFAGAPQVVVLDEPTSALDVSVQAKVLNLLQDLQNERNTAYLFISHDLDVVRYMAHRIGVMYRGRLIEVVPSGKFGNSPAHPYTRMLLAAFAGESSSADAYGKAETAVDAKACIFVDRCPCALTICKTAQPPTRSAGDDHTIVCWRQIEELAG